MRTLVLTVPAAEIELASDRLWTAGARAIEERTVGRGPDGDVELLTLLAERDDVARERLGPIPPHWRVEFVEIDDRPANTWREHVRPIEVGSDLILRPAWLPPVGRDGVLEVEIEPAGAFGLGDHPTTRLSAAAVGRHVRRGDRVLDVGCGSGVLGIIAALRGAARVTAIDIAEPAREATTANAARNRVAGVVTASTAPLATIDAVHDLVLANILAPTLVALAADLRRVTAANGTLVVSGILAGLHDHVLAALAPMTVVERDELDGWALVALRHP